MIRLDAVTKRFSTGPAPGRAPRTVEALRDVTLDVPAGGVRAVVGPNGAGKSTLFALLLGFLRPSRGSILVDGLPPRTYVHRRGAAYLPERFRLPGESTPRAALRALARLEGLASTDAARTADDRLDHLGLAAHAAKPIRALSRGLLQRLGIAQALLAPRDLVLLDEPTEGLDPIWRIRFREIVDGLRREGRTVLLASHDLAEVERLAGHAILLESGRVWDVIAIEPPAAAAGRYRLELARPVPAISEAFPGAVAETDTEGDAGPATYSVPVEDAAELSGRLAALLADGAIVVSVRPAAAPLEERVRRALEQSPEDRYEGGTDE